MSSAAVAGTAVEAIPTGTYQLETGRSSVSFTTRHMFGLAGVNGTLRLAAGQLVVASPATGSAVSAHAPAASFSTGNPKRDEHVLSAAFLDAEKNPTLEFQGTELTRDGDIWLAVGTLTAAGVTAPLGLTVTGTRLEGTTVIVTATGSIDRYAHGLVKMKGMAGRRLALTVSATFTKVSA